MHGKSKTDRELANLKCSERTMCIPGGLAHLVPMLEIALVLYSSGCFVCFFWPSRVGSKPEVVFCAVFLFSC